jgi:hypothetical protein
MPRGTGSILQAPHVGLVVWFAFAGLGLASGSLGAQQREIDSSLVGAEVRVIGEHEAPTRGVITGMWPLDSLAIKVGTSGRLSSSRDVVVQWNAIQRLERRDGNQWLRGAWIALATSAAFGVLASLNKSSTTDLTGAEVWALATGVSAIFTVPMGVLIGSQYPRWRLVYRSDESRR